MNSLRLSRPELDLCWKRVRAARRRYDRVRSQVRPEGGTRQLEVAALAEYHHLLAIFNDLALKDKV